MPVFVIDNTAAQTTPGLLGISVGGSGSINAKIGIDFTTRSANAYGGFTTSGGKTVEGIAIYPI